MAISYFIIENYKAALYQKKKKIWVKIKSDISSATNQRRKSAGDCHGSSAQGINQGLSMVKALFPLKQNRRKWGAKTPRNPPDSAADTFLSFKRKQNYPS